MHRSRRTPRTEQRRPRCTCAGATGANTLVRHGAAAAARGDGEQNWKAQSRRELPDMPPPPAFFCFGGFGTNLESKGGIELPFRDWPFENEYQFAFWVRFESFSQNVTTLFALASEADRSGITLTVDQGGNLNIRVGDSGLIAKGGSPTRVRCGTLRVRTWHHILVTHMRPRKFGSISNAFFAKVSKIKKILILQKRLFSFLPSHSFLHDTAVNFFFFLCKRTL